MNARDLRDVAAGMASAKRAEERERWTRPALEKHQRERLQELVAHASALAPFWRKRLPACPSGVRLEELPTLDKATLMEHFDDAVTDRRLRRDTLLAHLEGLDHDGRYLGRFRAMTTSGSSGLKGLFVYDRAGWRELLGQFFRQSAWVGTTPRLPRRRIAAIGGAGPTHMTRRLASTLDVGVHRLLSLPITMPLPELVERLNAFQPTFLNVFPSMASLLAAEQEAGRLQLRLESMSTSSELRTPGLAARIEAAFGVRPFDFYATTEGLWGCECEEHAGVHLFEDRVIVENVDEENRPVAPGQPGARLLVTNLFNLAQPLIRFELGDRVTVDGDPCACGRSLMRLRTIEGRTDDVLRLGGAMVLPMHFAVVTADAAVRQFQVVQEGEAVRVRVVLAPDADAGETCARLAERVIGRLAAAGVREPRVSVEPCQALDAGPGGKLQIVVADRTASV